MTRTATAAPPAKRPGRIGARAAGVRARPARAVARAALGALVIASALTGGLAAPAPASAAAPGLTISSATTYTVLPADRRIAVSTTLTATNRLRNTATRTFHFRTAYLAVLPGITNLRISGGSGRPAVSVSKRAATYTTLKIDLGANLGAGKSTTLAMTFDLVDTGDAPDRQPRISPSLVTFSAWAFATPETPGSTVEVRLPADYHVSIGRGPLSGPATVGVQQSWTSGPLQEPLEYVADVAADHPAELAETRRTLSLRDGGSALLVRHWPDDTAWQERVADLVVRAAPALERAIGVAWPLDSPLIVQEVLARTSAEAAGSFDPALATMRIGYAAPDWVILHELAHVWFNGSLVADRWAAEGFAAYYAYLVGEELGVAPDPAAEPVARTSPGAIPLNAWPAPTAARAPEDDYAHAAAYQLAREIAARAGADGLRDIWAKAAARAGAYPAAGALAPEAVPGPPDWRGLLDLLEQETGAAYADLWRTWVVRPSDAPELVARIHALRAYAATAARADAVGWDLPPTIRDELRAWRYEMARESLATADAVLDAQAGLERTAAVAGLTLPGDVERAFEGGATLAAAAAEAAAEQATASAIVEAAAARPMADAALDRFMIDAGLLATQPEEDLQAARAAFAAGDLEAAWDAAARAETTWSDAPRVGRGRIVSTALLALSLVLLVGLVQGYRRRIASA